MKLRNLVVAILFTLLILIIPSIIYNRHGEFTFFMILTGIVNSLQNKEGFYYHTVMDTLGFKVPTSSSLNRVKRRLQ